jgi:hypothetical protein
LFLKRFNQMAANPPVPGAPLPPAPAPPSDNTQQLITFLRQESQANRDALREDSTANRELLLGAIRIVAIPVGAAIVFLGLFGFKSFSDLKDQLQNSATQQINSETLKMQQEIRNRLDDQFKTPVLQGLVRDAARDATEKSAKPLIEAEVKREVQDHIKAEAPQIRAAVINETKLGVAQMKPQIDSEISKQAADAKASIEAQIAPYGALVNAGTLAELAQNGSGTAFDALMRMSGSSDPRIIELISTAHNAVFLQFENDNGIYMGRQFTVKKAQDELFLLLSRWIDRPPSMVSRTHGTWYPDFSTSCGMTPSSL